MPENPSEKHDSSSDPKHNIQKIDNQTNNTSGFRFYKKTQGGGEDLGKKYEIAMCILYALKLITNDSVVDFSMTSNNTDCGLFDDIELDVTFKNKKRRIFLMQLKYREDREPIDQNMLMKQTQKQNNKQQKSKFYLPNYLEAISKLGIHQDQDVVNILYTNRLVKFKKDQELMSFKSYALEVMKCNQIENRELLVNSQSEEDIIFHFKPDVDTQSADNEKLEKACEQFYILSEQDDLNTVEANIKEKLNSSLHCDVYSSFEYFMKNWWSDNFVLTKHHVISKLAELALSPYIRTLSAEKSNEKTQLLEEAIMNFEMTLVEDSQEDIVRNIWTESNTAYECTSSPLQKFFESPSEKQISKILWYLGKAPLVVKFDNSNSTTVNSVLTLLQNNNQLNRVVLLGDAKKVDFNERKVFENLADLENNFGNRQFYNDLISNFNVSFQDRGCISLKQLSVMDKAITKIIGTTELFEMSQEESFLIGNKKEELPPFYIPRCVSTYSTNIDEILKLYKQEGNNVIIVNCDVDIKEKLQAQNVQVVELSEYLTNEKKDETTQKILVSTSDRCARDQFDQVCKKFKKWNIYVFQVKPNDDCSLVLMKGKKPFLAKQIVEEKSILHYFDNPLNVLCAPPGMGKSSLIKVLYNNTPSDFWAIRVELINYNFFLTEKPNNQTIMSRFLKMDQNEDRVTTQIKEALWKNKRMYLFLDGLDEVDSKHVDLLIKFARSISSDGFNVWLSSRESLREIINQNLNYEAIEIEEIDKKQQHQYIQSKLERKDHVEKIENIVKAVYDSINLNNSQNLLGIPLQLHIITEMFLNNEEAYKNLEQQNIFVLTHMYKLFFQGKAKTVLEKLRLDESLKAQLGINDEETLEKYELPALKSCLDHSDYVKLGTTFENIEKFLTTMKGEGDKYGIIKSVDENNEVVFNHQTFAEYFACKWFSKHQEKIALLRNRIFSERYQNLRRIFDIMLAENNPLHLAVIYQNTHQFIRNIGDLKKIDDGGRTALHIACSYGTKCKKNTDAMQRESAPYIEMMEKLVQQDVDIYAMDNLFHFNCLNYAAASFCLYPVEKMLETSHTRIYFSNWLVCYRVFADVKALTLTAARFGYPNLLRMLLEEYPWIVNHKRRNRTLLKVAVFGKKSDQCLRPRNGNVAAVKVLAASGANVKELYGKSRYGNPPLNLLDIACREGRYDMIQLLIEMGLKCTGNNTILHRMLEIQNLDLERENVILTIAQSLKINLDAQNDAGTTALQIGCKKMHVHVIDLLLEIGIDVNIRDNKNNSALHYAWKSLKYFDRRSIKITRLLISRGIDIKVQNDRGVAALHLACESGHTDAVKMLLEEGADPDVKDNLGNGPLYYICYPQVFTGKIKQEIVTLLTDFGININTRTQDGSSVLQLVSKSVEVDLVILLLEKGADPYVQDILKNNVLHYACNTYKSNTKIISLLLDYSVDLNDRNEDGATPFLLACGKGQVDNVSLLLRRSADPYIKDNRNRGAWHYVCESFQSNTDIVKLLMTLALDVNAQTVEGTTALHLACRSRSIHSIKILLERGANPHIKDNKNQNVLHYTCKGQFVTKIVDLLINLGVDVNAQNDEGATPFHLACQFCGIDVVNLLKEKVTDPNVKDGRGRTALHYACMSSNNLYSTGTKIVSDLINLGIEIHTQDRNGTTALQQACSYGFLEIVRLLLEKGADSNVLYVDGIGTALDYEDQEIFFDATDGKSGITKLLMKYSKREKGISPNM